jgi:uncharacterized damage-inducible protein DinB
MDGIVDTIRFAHAHARWADDRLLAAVAGLTPEQFAGPSVDGEPIRETLVHVLAWHRWWLASMRGEPQPEPRPDPATFRSPAELRVAWQETDAAVTAALAGWDEADLAAVVAYPVWDQSWTHPRWQALLHQTMHALQHRSEVALRLTALGHSPGDLDLIVFMVEPDGP